MTEIPVGLLMLHCRRMTMVRIGRSPNANYSSHPAADVKNPA